MMSSRSQLRKMANLAVLAAIAVFVAAMVSGCFGAGATGPGPIHVQGGGTAPAAPTGLTATAGNAQVTLGWTASAGATSYNIYRGTATGTETLIKTGVTTTSFTDTGLTNGTTYFYKVTAVNAVGESAKSNEASVTPSATGGAPAAPTGLTATPSSGQVALSWNPVAGATSYNVYRGTSSGTETLFESGIISTTNTDATVTNGTTYYYEVTAVNANGESAKSNEVSATP